MTTNFDDIDTPTDETLLMGDEDDESSDPEALAAIAAEGEGEGEQEGEQAAAVEPPVEGEPPTDDEAPAPKRDAMIPRERFDEINARRKEAEDRARDLEARLAALEVANRKPEVPAEPPAPALALDLDAKEREYLEATYVGDTDTALTIRREIQAEERRMAAEVARAAVEQREAANTVKNVAAKAVEQFPFLNDNSGENPVMDEILEMRDFYAFRGYSQADALQQAVNKVAPQYAPATQGQPKPAAVDTRKAAALARNAATNAAQPPAPAAGVGNRIVPPSPKVETQADWEKLPAAERERLLQGA